MSDKTGYNAHFASWLRSRMYDMNLDNQKLAAELGTTVQQISRWRMGKCVPSPQYFTKLARSLQTKDSVLRNKLG